MGTMQGLTGNSSASDGRTGLLMVHLRNQEGEKGKEKFPEGISFKEMQIISALTFR